MSVSDLLILDRGAEVQGGLACVWLSLWRPHWVSSEPGEWECEGWGTDRLINQFSVTFWEVRVCELVFQERKRHKLYKPSTPWFIWWVKAKSGDKMFRVSIYDCLWPQQNKSIKSRSVWSNSRFYISPLFLRVSRASPPALSTNLSSRDNLQLPAKVIIIPKTPTSAPPFHLHLAQLPRP